MSNVAQGTDTPAVLYAAKSTDDKKGSIDTQLADGRAMGERERWSVRGEHRDEGFSAYRGNRGPGLEAAKAEAVRIAGEEGSCVLVVQHTDRLARGAGDEPGAADHLAEIFFWARRHNVQLRSVQDDSNLEDAIRAVLVGERNTEDSRRKSEAVRDGKRRQRERGERMGGRIHDGYRCRVERDDHDQIIGRHWSFDPEREPLFRRIFELGLASVPAATITRTVNAEGWRSKVRVLQSSKRGREGEQVGGKPLIRQRIIQILTDPFYAGLIAYNRRGRNDFEAATVEGDHPAYVTPEQHQRLVADYTPSKRPGKSGRPAVRHVLDGGQDGLGACADCGWPLIPTSGRYVRVDGTRKLIYKCACRDSSTGLCEARSIDAERLDAALLEHLDGAFLDFAGWFERIAQARGSAAAVLRDDLERERKAAKEAARKEKTLAARYAEHAGTDETLAAADAAAMAQQAELREDAEGRVRNIEAALAQAEEPTPVDVALDLHNELVGQVRAALGQDAIRDVRDGLRQVFARFYCRQEEDGSISVRPELRADAGAFAAIYEDGMRLVNAEAVAAAEAALRDPAVADAFGDRVAARPDVDADSEAMNEGQPSGVLADLLATVGERADAPPAVAAVLANPPTALPLRVPLPETGDQDW